MGSRQHSVDSKHNKQVLLDRSCIALVLRRAAGAPDDGVAGHSIFSDFLRQNSTCFWNACLMRSVAALEYRGCLAPCTLLVSGTNFALEVVRSAWARRVLRPPKGYTISKLGDVSPVDMSPVGQTHFAPLSEALCKVVADLNGDQLPATTRAIRVRLEDSFPEMQVPGEDILHKTLGGLIRERKVYHTGNGYFIVSPDTYRQRAASPLCERQMLMTNEEAIVRLHGENRRECSLAVQADEADIAAAWKCSTSTFLQARQTKITSSQSTQVPSSPNLQLMERSHSLRVLRIKGRPKSGPTTTSTDRGGSFKESKIGFHLNDLDAEVNNIHKNEKQSVLAKILKRMQFLTEHRSVKHVVFSAQFPPLEWSDDTRGRCYHSVATQTQLLMQKVYSKPAVKCPEAKIPWEDTQNNLDRKDFQHLTSPNRKLHSESSEGSSPRKNNTSSLPTNRHGNRARYSPTHRYSHHGTVANYAKKRHRHRRSSSESPRAQKASSASRSNSSRSNSEDKVYGSSSSGSALTAPSKQSKLNNNRKSTSSKDPDWPRRLRSSFSPKDEGASSSLRPPSSSLEDELPKSAKSVPPQMDKTPPTKIANNITPPSPPLNSEPSNNVQHCHKNNSNLLSQDSPSPEEKPEPKVGDSNCNSSSDRSVSCNDGSAEAMTPPQLVPPLVLTSFVEIPAPKPAKISSPKEIFIDNSVSVEVALDKRRSPPSSKTKTGNNVSTTIVTEETTVTKAANGDSKVVTVTSITTSLSHGGLKEEVVDKQRGHEEDGDEQKSLLEENEDQKNDLNIETEKGGRIIDCSSSCNITTEVK